VKLSHVLSFPNQLTLLRMVFLPFIIIKLVEGQYQYALILFTLAGLSDLLDGLLARTLGQQTLLGQYLDPIADKLLLSTTFLVFGKANTFAQLAAVFFVLMSGITQRKWIGIARLTCLRAVFAFTIISGLHYVFVVGHRLQAVHPAPSPPTLAR